MKTTTFLLDDGSARWERFGAVNPPVYHASTFTFPTLQAFLEAMAGRGEGYLYSREGNPTVRALEEKLAVLEGATACLCTASGMAAITAAILAAVQAGDHVLIVESCYGPVRRFLHEVMAGLGVTATFFHPETEDLTPLLRPRTRLVYLESPGSLSFHVLDLARLCEQAHRHGALVITDNSWATPLYQQPHRFGSDIVVHSGTKYIAGHSDVLLGVLTTTRAELYPRLRAVATLLGATLGPAEAYLALRGLRTLPLRLARHQENGLAVARWLQTHPKVRRVLHPGLPTFPRHELAARQMQGWSGLFGVELHPPVTPKHRHAFVNALHHFGIGVSWGGYESLILPLYTEDPTTAAHYARLGLSSDCYRLSIGLEDPDDLIADLEAALACY